jgi:hypothetical protein
MADPRPVSITQVPEADYEGAYAPEPLLVVGDLIPEAVQGIATVATADATDGATAATLANALKARLNALITALKS